MKLKYLKITVVLLLCTVAGSINSYSANQRYTNTQLSMTKSIESMGFPLFTYKDYKASVSLSHSMAVDASGNIYVAGTCQGKKKILFVNVSSGYDYTVIKYDHNLVYQWEAHYDNNKKVDNAYAVCTDASGNVYVTGSSQSAAGLKGFDIATIKYDQSGALQWVARYAGTANDKDAAYDIKVSPDGAVVYVCGETYNTTTHVDMITLAYNTSTGNQVWKATYDGGADATIKPFINNDIAYAMAVDQSTGDVVITGKSYEAATPEHIKGGLFATTIKYSGGLAGGSQIWKNNYCPVGAPRPNSFANAILINSSGNIFIAGTTNIVKFDYFAASYESNGTIRWDKSYEYGITHSLKPTVDVALALALDANNNIYITGTSGHPVTSSSFDYDYVTVKFDDISANTTPLWVNQYSGGTNDVAQSIAVSDAEGAVFVTGASLQKIGTVKTVNYVTQRLPIAGTGDISATWTGVYNNGKDDWGYNIAVIPADNNVVVTGTSMGSTTTKMDFATLLGPTSTALIGSTVPNTADNNLNETVTPNVFALFDAYPNPFNPTTKISFSLPYEGYVTLKVFNTLGQEVAQLYNHDILNEGLQETQFNAGSLTSGVYYYRITVQPLQNADGSESRAFTDMKKLLLLK